MTDRWLDLAAFAENRLDSHDLERVAAMVAEDADLAGDIGAARTLSVIEFPVSDADAAIVARAVTLCADEAVAPSRVLRFIPRPRLPSLASWGSLAAAIAVASWLGFAMGSDASVAFNRLYQPSDDGILHELLDPGSGFIRDLTDVNQT